MPRRSLLAFLLSLAFMLLLSPTAWARVSAQQFVKQKHAELTALLKQPRTAATETKIQAVVDGMLDYQALARRSLGNHWGSLSEAQRNEFTSVLTRLVRRAYRRDLRKTLDYQVSFSGSQAANSGRLVKTVARSRTNAREEPISIDYLLHEVGGRWRVFDIVTEGSSLVNNYRSQFNRIIKKQGFAELMRRMKKKLSQG